MVFLRKNANFLRSFRVPTFAGEYYHKNVRFEIWNLPSEEMKIRIIVSQFILIMTIFFYFFWKKKEKKIKKVKIMLGWLTIRWGAGPYWELGRSSQSTEP